MRMIVEDFYTYSGSINSAMLVITDDGRTENIRRNGFDHGVMLIANLYNDCSSRDARDIDIYSFEDESRLVYMHMNTNYKSPESDDEETAVRYDFTFCNESRQHVKDVVSETLNGHSDGSKKVTINISFVETFALSDKELSESVESWLPATYDFDNDELVFDVATEAAPGDRDYENEDVPF
jgi:hypothetical protein